MGKICISLVPSVPIAHVLRSQTELKFEVSTGTSPEVGTVVGETLSIPTSESNMAPA